MQDYRHYQNIDKLYVEDFEELEWTDRELKNGHEFIQKSMPENKEKVVDFLFVKLNRVIERLNKITDKVEDLEYRIGESENFLFQEEKVDRIRESIREMNDTKAEVRKTKTELRKLRDKELKNVKDSIYTFMKAISTPTS